MKFSKSPLILFFLFSCQGPWSYYPEDPETYQGIWTYAYVIAGRPVENVCLDKMHLIKEVRMHGFAFYKSANIEISGWFNGKDTSFFLQPDTANYAHNPNCFVGPKHLLPDVGKEFKLSMEITWDSAGQETFSVFSAKTYIPQKFKVLRAYDLDRKQYKHGDTVLYLPPPMDMQSHYFIPDYSDNVGGALVTMVYDKNVFWGENSIDRIMEDFSPSFSDGDTARKARFGDRRTIYSAENQQYGNMNKDIDSIPVIGMNMPAIGKINLLFYATTPEYFKFEDTFLRGGNDSRIKPIYNIEGGAGIFAGMLVDTFEVNLKISDNIKIYPYYKAQDVYCRTIDSDADMENYMLRKECIEYWDAIIWCEIFRGKPTDDKVCLSSDEYPYPSTYVWYNIPVADIKRVLTEEKFITWCEHRYFPIEQYPACGSAMVGYFKNGKSSPILEREVKKWCQEHPSDAECSGIVL